MSSADTASTIEVVPLDRNGISQAATEARHDNLIELGSRRPALGRHRVRYLCQRTGGNRQGKRQG